MNVLNIEERLKICENCPIYSPSKGICNPKLWLDPDTNEVSTYPQSGYIKGCGCMIKVKMRNLSNHCIAGKW